MNEELINQLNTKIAIKGTVTAKVMEITMLEDGTACITLAAPVEPKGVALISGRLQPTAKARSVWGFYYKATGLNKGDNIRGSIGRHVLITCAASRDEWGTWYNNRITCWKPCTTQQAQDCEEALTRMMSQTDTPSEEEIPPALGIDTPEGDLPF